MTLLLHQRTVPAVSSEQGTEQISGAVTTAPSPLPSAHDYLATENLAAVLEGSGDAVVIFDQDFRYLYVNAQAERQIGCPRADLLGNSSWKLFPEAVAPYWDRLTQASRERSTLTFAAENPETEKWTEGRCIPTRYNGDDRCLAIFYRTTRTDRRVERRRASAAEREALRILKCVSDAFIALDIRGNIVFANPQAGQLLSRPCEDLVGRGLWETWPLLRGTRIEYEYQRALRTREAAAFECCFEGLGRWLETQVYPSPQGGMYVTFREITERKAREIEQKRLLAEAVDRANRDPLTGLLNHRAFYERLHAERERTEREGGTMALALLDVDHFKFFNEAFGHQVGDDVLKQIAKTLRQCCRATDALGRLGGDEFALIVSGSAEREAREVIAEIRDRIEKEGFIPPGDCTDVPLGCSMGVANFPDEAHSVQEMVDLADQRLATAKHSEAREETNRFFDDLRQRDEGFSMLDDLVTAVDQKDRYTRKHSEDVVAYSQTIAERLGMSEQDRAALRIAALLHDVGKIGVPDRILRRPSQLSSSDFEVIKKHPTMGAAIIGAVPGMEPTLAAVLYHHEAWDGSGYPHGIAGESIPLEARILAVADGYSAMTTDRPYRKGMSAGEALEVLLQGAGTQWDARIVQVFVTTTPPDFPVD